MATYFVKTGGSDAATGLSDALAWGTVNKVNAQSLVPGDVVNFRGGDSFGGQSLQLKTNGTAANPITFQSYGTGQANFTLGISILADASYAVVSNLKVDAGPYSGAITTRGLSDTSASSGGRVSTNLTLTGCTFQNVLQAILNSNKNNIDWTITGCTFSGSRDSLLINADASVSPNAGASGWTITNCTFTNAGRDTALAFVKHGLYTEGASLVFQGNTITTCGSFDTARPGAGISIRGANNVIGGDTLGSVQGNFIQDCPTGLSFIPYSATAGKTAIVGNRIKNVLVPPAGNFEGIYIQHDDGAGGAGGGVAQNVESFIIANNTIENGNANTSGRAFHFQSTTGYIKLYNNVTTGPHFYNIWVEVAPTTWASNNNRWYSNGGTDRWRWVASGDLTTIATWRTNSGGGGADSTGNPLLGVYPNYAPSTNASPVIDRGTVAVDPTYVAYVPTGGTPPGAPIATLTYGGPYPDQGAAQTTPVLLLTPVVPGSLALVGHS